MVDSGGKNIDPQDHPCSPTRWRIINCAMLVGGEIPDLNRMAGPHAFLQRATGYRATLVHGALGYSTDTPLASMFQHARWARFADGADEIHQMRIAENTIKAYTSFGTTRTATGDLAV